MVHNNDESDLPPEIAAKRRILFADDEIQPVPSRSEGPFPGPAAAGTNTSIQWGNLPNLKRNDTKESIKSVRSISSRNRDPSLALPTVYRTVSFNITASQERQQAEASKEAAKAKAQAGGDFADVDWHLVDHITLYKRLETAPESGLTSTQASGKLSQYGRNVPSKPRSQLPQKLFGYFFGGFGSILFVGSILVFISWKPLGDPPAVANLALAIVLLGVWLLQALFNGWQDFSSSRVMNSITGMLPEDCVVTRDGAQRVLPAADIVPGDILSFKAGSKLPADIRFIEASSDARFDRSILTGESVPIVAQTESSETNYLETRCIGLQGTHCTSGSGLGIVVDTGDRTTYPDYMPVNLLIVNIVSIAIAFVPEGLPIAVTASLTIVANQMKQHNVLCKSLKTVETLGSVSVLLSDKTGTLTKGTMVATNCLIGFHAMTVDEAERELLESRDTETSRPKSKAVGLLQLQTAAAVNNAGEFDPTTIHLPLAERKVIGDATDAAILRLSERLGGNGSTVTTRASWRTRFDLAFNSKNKFALKVVSPRDSEATSVALGPYVARNFDSETDTVVLIKGAPDILMSRCTKFIDSLGEVHPASADFQKHLEHIKDTWSSEGKRVLLLARKILRGGELSVKPNESNFEEEVLRFAANDLVLVGLVGIVDPPRDEIPEVVSTLRRAGIRIHMVTGDFKLTAQAIARDCGIIGSTKGEKVDGVSDLPRSAPPTIPGVDTDGLSRYGADSLVISGPEIGGLSEYQWDLITQYPAVVFARTTPDQKLLITRAFRRRGYVVGMTGDGVNDAPSLREADIGICPVTASDIAIAASDMVLLDSFASIIIAVERGRTVFDNLKKTIAYLLPAGSFSEFWPVMTSVIFGLPQILSSFLMIVICCFTDCAAATALAYEEPEADVMLRKPRDLKKDKLVDWRLLLQSYGLVGMIETTTSFAMSYWYLSMKGIPFGSLWFAYGNYTFEGSHDSDYINYHLSVASAIYFVNLVVMQWFNLMALRTRRTSLFTQPPVRFTRTTTLHPSSSSNASHAWNTSIHISGNWYLFPAILIALVMIFIFCYIGGLQDVAYSAPVPGMYWGLGFAWGAGLLGIEESRKMLVRRSVKKGERTGRKGFWEKIAW
ncbi:Potassium-transporting ATPase alpha chain 2 [Cyphellophora attinorum]|uniref:Potassium-transporting ATPase alpha chain 2 n=1 Tax=Cyphellophora attinorum TaxID=1664694 RepID=A0A0N1HAE4_9EURO|nr:Potassium-transporting ATPase alpha chain 2 [Phialophora attinorum]KPI39562.1 Potassium-transporting ATPase alpha chain 2 [Phialophora attinorum]